LTFSNAPDTSKEREFLSFVYEAFNRRDIEPILAVMHPEVEWPNGMEGGRVHGREGVRSYWTRQWGMLDPQVEPIRFEHDGGRIVLDVHPVVRELKGTVLLDRIVQHLYQIRDGLILRRDIRE